MKKPKIFKTEEETAAEILESIKRTEEYEMPNKEKRKKAKERLEITLDKEKKVIDNLNEAPMTKKDIFAMIISAFLTIGLPTILIVGIIILFSSCVLGLF